MGDGFKPILARLVEGHPLTSQQAHDFFAACLRGEPTPSQVAAAAIDDGRAAEALECLARITSTPLESQDPA